LRVTDPPDSPEELAAIQRRIWRKQLRASLNFVVVVLGVALAVVGAVNRWGCAPIFRSCTTTH
jgi:hypothetical protein